MIAYHSNNILNQDNTKIKTNFVVMTFLAVLLSKGSNKKYRFFGFNRQYLHVLHEKFFLLQQNLYF